MLNEIEKHVQNLRLVSERLHQTNKLLLIIRISIIVISSLLLLICLISSCHKLLSLLSLLSSLDLLLNLLDRLSSRLLLRNAVLADGINKSDGLQHTSIRKLGALGLKQGRICGINVLALLLLLLELGQLPSMVHELEDHLDQCLDDLEL